MDLQGIDKLNKDVKDATATLSRREARYLVDTYYQVQEYRISSANQVRSMAADGEPNATLSFFNDQMKTLERQIQRTLDQWTDRSELGQWAKSIVGIGPVISAGLLAHIDIEKAVTAGHVWSYAGLNPDQHWGKGQKRPWNASLKVICWKAGESFVKVSNNDKDFYGHLYAQRKERELTTNEGVRMVPQGVEVQVDNNDITRGMFTLNGNATECWEINGAWYFGGYSQRAWETLKTKKIGKDTDAYKAYSVGKLPPAHIHARAKRWAVKLFLAHFVEVGRRMQGLEVPKPYAITYLEHTDVIVPPNFPQAA